MKEKRFGYGPWEYLYACQTCGNVVRAPLNKRPCKKCGGDFGPKTAMRKLYLEKERPLQLVEREVAAPKTFFDKIREFFGFYVEPRYITVQERIRPERNFRWQTHSEVEEESGIMRHEDFL